MRKAIIAAVTAVCILFGTAAYTGLRHNSVAEADDNIDVRETAGGSLSGKTVILHSGDVHGAIDGYPKMASLKKELESAGADVVVVDAGGFSSGTLGDDSFGTVDGFKMMRSVGYNAATLGESEFAEGYDELRSDISGAKMRLICANVLKDDKSILNPDYIYEAANGSKIGFFGLTSPASCDGLKFLSGDDMYASAKTEVDSLNKNGAGTVIALAHLGIDGGAGASSTDLYKNVDGIDFIIDGHDKTAITEGPNGEPIQSAGEGFAYIGVVVIGSNGAIEDHYVMSTDTITSDDGVQADADKIKENTKVAEIGKVNNVSSASSDDKSGASAGQASDEDDKTSEKTVTANEADTEASNTQAVEDEKKSSAEEQKTEDEKKSSAEEQKTEDEKKASAEEQKTEDEKKSSTEEQKTEDEKKASAEEQKAEDEKKASAEEQKTEDEKKASAEEQKAEDEKKASAEEQKAEEDKTSAAEQEAVVAEENKAEEEQKAADELASLKDGKYEVVKGDCLWNIAKKYLGDGARWGEIYELNKGIISNPSLIYVGQQLVLPPG